MPKKLRQRTLGSEDEEEVKWELTNILSEELQDEISTMWEIPQIFHFLHMFKDVLNISHLSMYETERMLAMPRASKQLANIMTCLLSPPLPKSKIRKTPPMPYEFWVNLVIHKVNGWFKVYRSKHQDIAKVFEAIGVEPAFWKVFPDSSILDKKDFDELMFKERIWILKSICDTLFHTRKTIQDKVSKQSTEDNFETILGVDRYGAKYFYFPLFLDSDLRVYRHCIDNTILSTVKAPRLPSVPKPEKYGRNKRKRSRWKNGSLPVREKRRSRKMMEDEVKLSGDSAIGSLISEDTNMSGISGCSNNNSIATETIGRNGLRCSSKTPEENITPSETQCSNPKSSGYDTNTSSDAKSVNSGETDEVYRRLGSEADTENSMDRICTIQDILDELTSKISESLETEESSNIKKELDSSSNLNVAKDIKDDEGEEAEEDDTKGIDDNMSESDREESRVDSESDDSNWTEYKPRTLSKDVLQRENILFSGLLDDLSVSNFELVADSVESLRDLAASLLTNQVTKSRSKTAPICEIALATRMEELVESLKDVEPVLKESAMKARRKLQREWTMFKDGVEENRDTSGDVDHGSNRWILGSQGCPLFSSSDATLQALSEFDLPSPSPEIPVRRTSSAESDDDSTGDQTIDKKVKSERRVKITIEKEDNDDNDDDDENDDTQDSKTEPEPRRVLRRRGISSYTEQLSSSEEEAYELEEWSHFTAVDETPTTPDSSSAVHSGQKNGEIVGETAEKDSDQDWILPGARKRKNKRSPTNRKLKYLPQKPQTNNSDSKDPLSINMLPPHNEPPIETPAKSIGLAKDLNNTEAPFICKVESIHSVLDIKDEGPIFEYNRNVTNSSNEDPLQSPVQQYYAPPTQQPPRPRGPSMAPSRPQMDTSYFVQGPENYFNPGPPPPYMRYSFPQVGRGPVRYPFPPAPMGYACQPDQQNYWQYQNYGQMPPRPFPVNIVRPGYPTQRAALPQRHQVSSTTLYSARSPSKPPIPRMPAPRLISGQNANPRGIVRPRLPAAQPAVRRYGPRNPTGLQPGMRGMRPVRPKTIQETKAPATKTTSLILLSDSDDEIEMIVSEKRKIVPSSPTSNRQGTAAATAPPNRVKPATPADRSKSKPVITSEITVPKSREMLSPQMLQRMSQGGISITPVKPPASKQMPVDTSAGTKLVVVVNETGSHYALALPNGSKLILTPEQVAQIRASNGGKLVL